MGTLKKILDVLGNILAIVWLITYILLVTNANFHYLDNIDILLNALALIREWGALLLVAIVGFESVANRGLVLIIIYLVLLAVCVIFMFLPGTTDQIFNMFN